MTFAQDNTGAFMITGMFKSRKGDKSLEMIIGMLILLVVAGVVINLFLSKVNPGMLPTIDPVKEKRDQVLRVRRIVR